MWNKKCEKGSVKKVLKQSWYKSEKEWKIKEVKTKKMWKWIKIRKDQQKSGEKKG